MILDSFETILITIIIALSLGIFVLLILLLDTKEIIRTRAKLHKLEGGQSQVALYLSEVLDKEVKLQGGEYE